MRTYQRRQLWKREEAAKRAKLRPLRNAVNLAMRRAGIPHAKTIYSSRVKGWPISWSAGYESDSNIWSSRPHVVVTCQVGKYQSVDDFDELYKRIEEALSGFEYQKSNRKFEVYGKRSPEA